MHNKDNLAKKIGSRLLERQRPPQSYRDDQKASTITAPAFDAGQVDPNVPAQ